MNVVIEDRPAPTASKWRQWATHDYFPHFSANIRRIFYNPFGILVCSILAALVCGLFLHPQGYVLAASLGTMLLFGILFPWLSLRGLTTQLRFDQTRTIEQEAVAVRLAIKNNLPWGAWGLAVRYGFTPTAAPVASIAALSGRLNGSCHWNWTPLQRGVYPNTPPLLTTGFPFGLWECQKSIPTERPLIVWPKVYPVGPIPNANDEHAINGSVPRNKAGTQGDLLGVRPYRRGDSLSRVHWPLTAKHDHLIVCEYQATARPVIQLVLDIDPAVHAGSGSGSSREWAIRVAASLAYGWLNAGTQVGIAWANQQFSAASGETQINIIMDALAAIPATANESLNHLLNCPVCRPRGDVTQIIITTERGIRGLPQVNNPHRKYIILHEAGFSEAGSDATSPEPLPVRPWLWMANALVIPHLLRAGWEEARHGG